MNAIGCLIKTIVAVLIISLIVATVIVVGFYAALGAVVLIGAYRLYKWLTKPDETKATYA